MNQYKLSICIPTYNRGFYLKSTLQSIISQANDDIQIVISDNFSTDNTEEIVLEFQNEFKNIKYIKQTINLGADLNYLEVVKNANGEYCWLLGSDDQIADRALEIVMNEISNGHDIYVGSRINCNILMTPINTECFLNKTEKLLYELNNCDEFIEYIDNSNSIASIFSYLSSLIFLKRRWDNIVFDNTFNGSAYSHVFMLLSFISQKTTLKYITFPIVYNRCGNDSFITDRKLERFLLDINGYTNLTDYFFEDNRRKLAVFRLICRVNSWKSLYYARLYATTNFDWLVVESKLIAIGYSRIKLMIVRYTRFLSFLARYFFRIRQNYIMKK